MIRVASICVVAVLSVGCPGLKRPPPSAQRAAAAPTPTPTPARTAPEEAAPPTTPTTPALAPEVAFAEAVAEIRAGYEAFLATPGDRAAWEALMARLQAAEEQGFALLESSQEPEVEQGVYELGDLRAELSEREP